MTYGTLLESPGESRLWYAIREPKGAVRWGAIPPVLLRDRVRDRNGVKYYSIRTEQAYYDWIRRFIIFHGKRHPSEMGAPADVHCYTAAEFERKRASLRRVRETADEGIDLFAEPSAS